MRKAYPGDMLLAPGILRNPVPVDAMFERDVAHEVTLRNLVQRKGYESFEAAIERSREAGFEKGVERATADTFGELRSVLRAIIDERGFGLSVEQDQAISACSDAKQLMLWARRAGVASSSAELFSDEGK